MMTFTERLGKEIFRCMSYNEISIEDLSEKIDLSCNDILRACCGELILPPYIIEKFAKALNTTKSELVNSAKKGDWILCKDMMPEDDERYLGLKHINCLVTTESGTVTKVQRMNYRKDLWKWTRVTSDVVAWMSLPEKYKE